MALFWLGVEDAISGCTDANYHAYAGLILSVRSLLDRGWSAQLFHIHKEANRVADALAKLGARQTASLKTWSLPPQSIVPLLVADLQ
ncbi:Reverse transcriptase-like [Sesbania bispinosa]|nr:Reverse transcriptase-like [Sesbania bispinosa]